jgi:hypothetical protein
VGQIPFSTPKRRLGHGPKSRAATNSRYILTVALGFAVDTRQARLRRLGMLAALLDDGLISPEDRCIAHIGCRQPAMKVRHILPRPATPFAAGCGPLSMASSEYGFDTPRRPA